jgi:hypothetical protein
MWPRSIMPAHYVEQWRRRQPEPATKEAYACRNGQDVCSTLHGKMDAAILIKQAVVLL